MRECKDSEKCDKTLGHFLQSKEWEEFQRSLGREVFRIGEVLITKLPLIAGKSYLYSGGFSDLGFKIYDLRKLARENQAIFIKYESMTDDKDFAQELVKLGFKKSAKEVQPQRTIVLDLTKNEEDLLLAMHQKTRYNTRLAVKQGVKITNPKHQIPNKSQTPNSKSEMDEFWELMQKTSSRDKFSSHTKEYYEKLIPFTKLLVAQYNGKTIAANIILFYGDTAYYVHGASDYEHRSLMAPYLLHWETIKYAKERGYKKYDLWGIDEKKWPGVTRFKSGFGGQVIEYIGSFDCVFQPFWYKLYNVRNKLKSLR